MASITLNSISKIYTNGVIAVKNVSLDIRDGEFMILLGPSGCGKSTTLRMIAGLETVSSGNLMIGDKTVNHTDPSERDIAIVFQNYALYPHMTVKDNLAFGLKLRHMPDSEIQGRIQRISEMLGIGPLLTRKPSQLSGGQRQRVALGRALVREPKAFLLDEPLSNLDAKLRAAMRTELIKLHQRLGTTIVHVTHDQVEAMTMGERMCIMKDGEIVQVGAPMEVYRNPADTFVAGFLASPPMNLLHGRIEGTAAIINGTRLTIPPSFGTLPPGDTIIGMRPEDFHLARNEKPNMASTTVVAVAIEVLGPEVILVGALGSKEGPEIHARMQRDFRTRPGEVVTLYFDLDELQLFDPTSTRALKRRQHG